MKKTNQGGFTLAELLIVVAIIGILVAIAIPTFKNQIERSREAVDLSALRSAYSEAVAKFMTTTEATYTVSNFAFAQQTDGWIIDISEFDQVTGLSGLTTTGTKNITFTRSVTSGSLDLGVWDSIAIS